MTAGALFDCPIASPPCDIRYEVTLINYKSSHPFKIVYLEIRDFECDKCERKTSDSALISEISALISEKLYCMKANFVRDQLKIGPIAEMPLYPIPL